MTKVLPLLLLLLLTGCASRTVDAGRFHQLAQKQGLGHLYYCGTKEGYHYFAESYFLKPTKRYRLPASDHPILHPFPKTSDRSAWIPWLVDWQNKTHGLRSENELRLLLPSLAGQPALYDEYWLNQTSWPSAMTNGHLTYQRVLEWRRDDETFTAEPTTFEAAQASGKRYSAYYLLNFTHLLLNSEHKLTNSSQSRFGPDFEWLPDGRLRQKGYHYSNGLKEHHWLDTTARPVLSIYSDHHANTLTMLRYDTSGNVAMYSTGPEQTNDPERPAKGETKYFIGDRKVTADEFIKAFRQYRREDIVGNKKQ